MCPGRAMFSKFRKLLAQHFTRPDDSPLSPEQLRTLRALGYIQ